MKHSNRLKRAAASALAVLFLAGSWACSSADHTWAMKRGGTTIPIGAFVYNFYASTQYASYQEGVDSSVPVLQQQIDGMAAEDWIRQDAISSTENIFVMNDLMEELGLSLSKEDEAQIETNANAVWSQVPDNVKKDVAKTSYILAVSRLNYQSNLVFRAIYDTNGTEAVPQQDLENYVTEHYTDFSYIYAPFYNSDFEVLEDKEKEDLKEQLEGYVEKIQDGSMTMEKAAEAYEESSERSDTLEEITADLEGSGYPESMLEALEEMKAGEVRFLDLSEDSSGYMILYKKDIAQSAKTWLEDDDNRLSILLELKGEEFQDMVEQRREALSDVEYNMDAINAYRASGYYTFVPPSSSSSSESSSGASSQGTSSSSSSETASGSSGASSEGASSAASSASSEE